MGEAMSRGLSISIDPASTGPLREFGVDRFLLETVPVGLIIPNRDEALLLTGAQTPERAAEELSERYGTAVVKLGPEGALVARKGRVIASSAGMEGDVVDSTGAGDAFAAGFLTARLAGADEEQSIVAGCRAGAQAVALVGGRPGYGLGSNRLYPIHTD
jgi:sugar/nucleoside kinase (ribokinase family)